MDKIQKNTLDYGAEIDAAIIDSLNKNYSILTPNNDQFKPTKIQYTSFKDENSVLKDNDIIGMMWEPELDFVDDPECFNECKNKNSPMRYMCGICLGQFRTRCALDIHFRLHKGENFFKCVLCDNIFSELAALKHHRELHNINELVACGICGLVFTEMYNMIKHRKKYHFKENKVIN